MREMRRKDREVDKEQIEQILNTASNGVLAVNGEDGYPYAVPLSFSYLKNKIYFHSTTENSHKIDAIRNNPCVSFCVVTQDDIVPEEFTTNFKSVILFGKARVLTDEKEIFEKMMLITGKYCSEHMKIGQEYAKKYHGEFCIVEIEIEKMTGKIKD